MHSISSLDSRERVFDRVCATTYYIRLGGFLIRSIAKIRIQCGVWDRKGIIK